MAENKETSAAPVVEATAPATAPAPAPAAEKKQRERKPKEEKPKKEKAPAAPKAAPKVAEQKDTGDLLGIEAKKAVNFADWYTQVITRSEMLEYYDISGCYILRPWAFNIWENIQSYFDGKIKESGVKNSYFPIFVSGRALNKEEDELEGFGAEVAWVTRSGKTDLAEPIAVRPTSETVMYPAFKKWITSHRDLPLRLNQWCNVVRWEFKHPVPFIRTREFLWQEGHSAFSTLEEAKEEVMEILNLYGSVYEDILAVPVVRGKKSDKEKFAGALFTTTVEAFIPCNGRAVQAATSHCLGQTFAKMFEIEFENDKHEKQYAWQNSWGLTTRSIGVAIMVHGDDKGLVLPPRVAPIQVVVIPLRYKGTEEATRKRALELAAVVKACGVRTYVDDSDHTGGWKYNHWEVKGVPLRMELGPKDITNEQCVLVRRDTGAKESVAWVHLAARVQQLLGEIQRQMLERARADREAHTVRVTSWDQFVPALDGRNICLCTWCGQTPCEEDVKARSAKESLERADAAADASMSLTGSAKTLCTPFEQPPLPEGAKCFACGKPATAWTLFGRSY